MIDTKINISHPQSNFLYKEVETELPTWKRVLRFVIALVATLPLIGLCFKTIRDYWVQVWTGKETILQKYTPVEMAPPKIEGPKPILVKEKKPDAPKKEVRFDLPKEEKPAEVKPELVVEPAKPIVPLLHPSWSQTIKEGLPAAAHSVAFTAVPYIAAEIAESLPFRNLIFLISLVGLTTLYAKHVVKNQHTSICGILGAFGAFYASNPPRWFEIFPILGLFSASAALVAHALSRAHHFDQTLKNVPTLFSKPAEPGKATS